MRVALLFTDGVGIGCRDPAINPLARESFLLSQFEDGSGTPLAGGRILPLETTFGVAGRPQSATNQTAIFTGEPAPKLLGRHLLGFPNPTLRELIDRRSIVKRLCQAGKRAAFVNAYPAAYLDALGLRRRPSRGPDVQLPAQASRRLRPSATTCAFAAGDVALRTFDDARNGEALTHDITASAARARAADLPSRNARSAAEVFWRVALDHDFTLFEHFLADEAGHAQDWAVALDALSSFDRFARAVLDLSPPDTHVFICSDHGNVEDLSSRNHTRNPVALLSFGDVDKTLEARTVADVGLAVLKLLEVAA